MNKNILLVEPTYNFERIPISLQKIAAYHLSKNDNIKYSKSDKLNPYNIFEKFYPDTIYITTLFTFNIKQYIKIINKCKYFYPKANIKIGGIAATLMPDYIEKETGIKPHIGLFDEVENCIYNFNVFPHTEYINIFTTKGCIRKCEFCAVKTLEPKYYIIDNWKEQIINSGKRNIIIQDNNFTASPWKHKVEVIDFLKKNNCTVDFNQALDARLFNEKTAKLFSDINFYCVRFAFDNMEEDKYIQKAIELCKKYRLSSDIRIYVLYNFKDSPKDFYYRLKEIYKLGAKSFPMRFQDLLSVNKNEYIGSKWTKKQLNNFKKMMNSRTTKIIKFNSVVKLKSNSFDDYFGRTQDEFIDKLNSYREKNNSTNFKLFGI